MALVALRVRRIKQVWYRLARFAAVSAGLLFSHALCRDAVFSHALCRDAELASDCCGLVLIN